MEKLAETAIDIINNLHTERDLIIIQNTFHLLTLQYNLVKN